MSCDEILTPGEFMEKYFNIKLFNYQRWMINRMCMMIQCPRCKSYMSWYIKPICGDYIMVYFCRCGYSLEEERYEVSDHTVVDINAKLEYTDHT